MEPAAPRSAEPVLLVGLFLAAVSLRPQLVGLGPLLPSIQHGLHVSHSIAGLLSTIIVLCMGVVAPLAFVVARRFGLRSAIGWSVATIAAAGLARALVPSAPAALLLTVPIGVGIAVAGSLMPLAVRQSWHHRPLFATGVYTTGISLGAALSAALAVPLADVAGGWRGSLAVLSCATGLVALAWTFLVRGLPDDLPTPKLPRLPWREPTAWLLVALFTAVSVLYYGIGAWLPASYIERGWSHTAAGNLLTVLNGVTVPVSVLLAWQSRRIPSRRVTLGAGALLSLTGVLGVILLPGGGWGWAVALGASTGLLFPSIMTLPLDAAHSPADVSALAAFMLGGGYALSAGAPFLLGALRDATGSFTSALWLMAGDACVFLLLSTTVSARRLARSAVLVEAA